MHENIPGWPPSIGERVRVLRTGRFGIVSEITGEGSDQRYVVDLEGSSGDVVAGVKPVIEDGEDRKTYAVEDLELGP